MPPNDIPKRSTSRVRKLSMEVMEVPKRIRRLSDAIKNELRIKHPPPRTYGPTESFFEDDTGRGRLKAKSPKQPIHRRPSYHGQHISKESIQYPDIHLRDDNTVKYDSTPDLLPPPSLPAPRSFEPPRRASEDSYTRPPRPIGRDLRYGFEGSARRPAEPPRAPSRMDKVLPPTPPSSSSTSARNSRSPPRAPGGPPHLYASTTDPSRPNTRDPARIYGMSYPAQAPAPSASRPSTRDAFTRAPGSSSQAPISTTLIQRPSSRAAMSPSVAARPSHPPERSGGARAVPQLDAVRRANTQPQPRTQETPVSVLSARQHTRQEFPLNPAFRMARDPHGRPPTTQAMPPRAFSTSMRAAQVPSPTPPRFPLRPPSPASSASKYSNDDDEDESVYCAPGAPTTVRRQPALHYPNSASTPPLNIHRREPPLGTPLARANTDPRRDATSTRARLAAAHRPTASDVTPPRSAPPNRRPTAYGVKASGAARLVEVSAQEPRPKSQRVTVEYYNLLSERVRPEDRPASTKNRARS